MGKPAATLGDLAAHGGTVTLGSPDVRIGGRPAARKGDPVTCPVHGPTGVIDQASATVFINGRPAARLGDVTMCAASSMVFSPPPAPPAVLGPATTTSTERVPITMAEPPAAGTPSTPPRVWSASGDPAASDKPRWENDLAEEPSRLHAESITTDVNRDGQYDTYEGSAAYERVRQRAYAEVPLPFNPIEVGGTVGTDTAYANVRGSAPTNGSALSLTGRAEAGLWKAGAMGTVAPSGSNGANPYGDLGAEVNLLQADARADVLAGNSGNRTGVVVRGEAGAAVLKGDVYGGRGFPLPGDWSIEVSGKGGAAAGAIGAGAGGWAFFDHDADRFNVGALGRIAVLFGVRLDVNLSVGRETQPTPLPPSSSAPSAPPPAAPGVGLAGMITQGNPTVLIGG